MLVTAGFLGDVEGDPTRFARCLAASPMRSLAGLGAVSDWLAGPADMENHPRRPSSSVGGLLGDPRRLTVKRHM